MPRWRPPSCTAPAGRSRPGWPPIRSSCRPTPAVLGRARAAGVPLREFGTQVGTDAAAQPGALPDWPAGTAAILDGLLGIGLNRPAGGRIADWIAHVNASGLPVFALDVPSGLFADTGAGKPAVQAARTLTFLAAKPGLLTLDGRDRAGAIDIAPLGSLSPPACRRPGSTDPPCSPPLCRHGATTATRAPSARWRSSAATPAWWRAAAGRARGTVHGSRPRPYRLPRALGAGLRPMHPELMLHALADRTSPPCRPW